MKMKIKILLITLITTLFILTGCLSTYTYSFAENNNQTAEIKFEHNSGILFIDLEGQSAELQEKSYLSSIVVPAGKQLNIRVYVYWNGASEGNRRRGVFKCPPLEAGGEYRLRFNFKTTNSVFVKRIVDDGKNTIVLERKRERADVTGYLFGRRSLNQVSYDLVHSQAIPPLEN